MAGSRSHSSSRSSDTRIETRIGVATDRSVYSESPGVTKFKCGARFERLHASVPGFETAVTSVCLELSFGRPPRGFVGRQVDTVVSLTGVEPLSSKPNERCVRHLDRNLVPTGLIR